MSKFKLSESFLESYKEKNPEWGPLGELVFIRTYSRLKENQEKEKFWECLSRVVEGCFKIQQKYSSIWDLDKAQQEAQEMYHLMFEMKFLPPGRSLWMAGTEFVDKRGAACLNNCGFVSTNNLPINPTKIFTWTMDMLMLGVGIGFDTKGAGKITIKNPSKTFNREFIIPDTREGWVESVRLLLKAFLEGKELFLYDYSKIRQAGLPLKGFGGKSSGSGPLKKLLENLYKLLNQKIDQNITSTMIVDIMDMIGVCVVSGNIRRSALISLGSANDSEFIQLKDDTLHPKEVESHRWASNNSIEATPGLTDYSKIVKNIQQNGEPGIVWLDNCRQYGRLKDLPDGKDHKVMGVNPCLTGNTRILTTKDYISINELVGKQFTAIVNGKEYQSTSEGFWSTGIKPIFCILTSNALSIHATGNHKFKTGNNQWKMVSELVPGQDKIKLVSEREIYDVGILAIIPQPEEEVYDCSIPDGHTFIANGFISHNCGEQSLESYELCNLVEVFPSRHSSYEEFEKTLYYAFLYGKSISLLPTHLEVTNQVIQRNRRIGVSQSGIINAFSKHGREEMLNWSDQGYRFLRNLDKQLSEKFGVNQSIKITTVKPSGTVSFLPGVSPGIHYPHSKYYLRRIRLSDNEKDIIDKLVEAGYPLEKDKVSPNTIVVSIPVYEPLSKKSKNEATIEEQIQNAVDYQREWSDNNVSITVTFNPETEGSKILSLIQQNDSKLKAISFLSISNHGYKQVPYEEIDERTYLDLTSRIKKINLSGTTNNPLGENFCDGDVCLI